MEIVRAPVGVEAQRQPMRREDLAQARNVEAVPSSSHQKRRIDRARRVIHRHDQIERRQAPHPNMARSVLMQHHPRHRPARPLAPVRAATLGLLQKTLRMQKGLRPGVAPGECVSRDQLLVKMLGREAAGSARDTKPPLPAPDRPEPACPRPCPAADPKARPRHRLRNVAASAETFARRFQAAPPLPTDSAPPPRSGSICS